MLRATNRRGASSKKLPDRTNPLRPFPRHSLFFFLPFSLIVRLPKKETSTNAGENISAASARARWASRATRMENARARNEDEDDDEDEQIASPDRYSALFIPAYVRLRPPIAFRVD